MQQSSEFDKINSESTNVDAWLLFDETTEDENTCDHGRNTNQQRKNYALGICIVVFAVFCECGSTICAQALGQIIPMFELNIWRFALQPLLVLPIIMCKKIPFRINRNNIPDVFMICVLFNIYNALFYNAATYLPVGTISGINSALMLTVVAMVTVVISKKCTFYTSCSVVLCITGMILTSQPGFIFNHIYDGRNLSHFYHPLCYNSMNRTIHNNAPSEGFGYGMLTITACAASLIILRTRIIREEVDAFVLCFWVGISGTLFSPLLMFILEDFVFPTSLECQLLLFAHSLMTVLSTISYLNALRLINPLLFTLLRSLQIILMCISQYTFMKTINPGKHNLIEITGVLTLFVGIIITPAYELYLQYREFK